MEILEFTGAPKSIPVMRHAVAYMVETFRCGASRKVTIVPIYLIHAAAL
jgi:hypothetical protein